MWNIGCVLLSTVQLGKPFDHLAIDVLEPMPLSVTGNCYIVVFSDYLS